MIITPVFAEVSFPFRSVFLINCLNVHEFCKLYLICSTTQLKQQDTNNASRKKAIEELEKSINMAEATCPGITDKMVKKLMEKFQK